MLCGVHTILADNLYTLIILLTCTASILPLPRSKMIMIKINIAMVIVNTTIMTPPRTPL